MSTITLAAQTAKQEAERLETLSREEAETEIADALEIESKWGTSGSGGRYLKEIAILITFGGPNTRIRFSGAGAFIEVAWGGDVHVTHIREDAPIVLELDQVWELVEDGTI
jgi:hypothetical protein